ncbi:Flavoprotein transmembrane component [Metarhizium album ARSEF 1941]|uniref:Flavoprotein transmembrane component n=1 Tax=Metarhizium album (strain ARSEF 1941) TaxID=1081103 RepID=A0A0B2WX15_METAS|nr:Flavoprotein transmembrane component [Metarhizium album ARSEF 1941]KHN97977.1 Flavoprotein transmembrane component [Metarhizium album ARSEF 1941]
MLLEPRHVQNHSEASDTQAHWGYPDRVVPCKNDAGSCAYLDVVYRAHDLGMLYMGILWATIFGVVFVWALLRRAGAPRRGALGRMTTTVSAASRRLLLREASRRLFGRTTRLQVVVLALLSGYLAVWSFLGISYRTWVTPVKNMPGVYNTRTGLGPWSDRVGVVAYALTPLSVLLSSRESLLSVLTGVPYQSFNFLHRWLGYIILLQSLLHTVGWLVIQLKLYQPQPSVSLAWIVEPYIIWGLAAMILLLIMSVLCTPWAIRTTGYEFFRKTHYVLAMVYVGACWAHWSRLECFLVPALVLWGVDRGARFVRTGLLHHRPRSPSALAGFKPAQATITRFPDAEHGDVLRLDLENAQDPWSIGQHYFLCFVESSIWQSHPFTPLNAPVVQEDGLVKHSYVLRAKSGETRKLAELAASKSAAAPTDAVVTTPVLLTGGYGQDLVGKVDRNTNVVCVAGGTGIVYVLSTLLHLARHRRPSDRKIELIWAMRHARDADWVRDELAVLRDAQKDLNLTISLFATRDAAGSVDADVASSSSEETCPRGEKTVCAPGVSGDGSDDQSRRRPDLGTLLGAFVEGTIAGRTVVFASGPGGIITDLRSIVAGLNVPGRVWRRQDKFDVELVCDDRLEW